MSRPTPSRSRCRGWRRCTRRRADTPRRRGHCEDGEADAGARLERVDLPVFEPEDDAQVVDRGDLAAAEAQRHGIDAGSVAGGKRGPSFGRRPREVLWSGRAGTPLTALGDAYCIGRDPRGSEPGSGVREPGDGQLGARRSHGGRDEAESRDRRALRHRRGWPASLGRPGRRGERCSGGAARAVAVIVPMLASSRDVGETCRIGEDRNLRWFQRGAPGGQMHLLVLGMILSAVWCCHWVDEHCICLASATEAGPARDLRSAHAELRPSAERPCWSTPYPVLLRLG